MLTRKELREEIAPVFGFYESTASNGSATTVIDSGLSMYGNDYWNGCWLMLLTLDGASPNGDVRRVVDYVSSTGTLSVFPAFTGSGTAQANDTYQLYQNVSPDEINRAIMRSSKGAEVATSLTPSTTALDYYLTSAKGLQRRQQITGVWLREQNLTNTMPRRITNWELEDAQGMLTIRIPQLLTATDHFWITYLLDEESMLSDTESINLPAELVRARAVVYLIEILLSRQGISGTDRWGTMMRMWSDIKIQEERAYQSMPRRASVYDWTNTSSRDTLDRLGLASKYG